MDADLVLLAMGFTGPVKSGMIEELGVELDARGNVSTGEDHMSSIPAFSRPATCAAANRWWCGRSPKDGAPPGNRRVFGAEVAICFVRQNPVHCA